MESTNPSPARQESDVNGNSSLAIALSWAALGLRLFPVALLGSSKVPWIKWKDQATTDRATLEEWFGRWPTCVPGVVMENGICAVDFDDPAALWHYGYDWPATWQQKTRRGVHYVYRGGIPCSVKVLAPDIDTRGTINGKSGYIVAWAMAPASRDAFAAAPQWLVDWAAKRGQKNTQSYTSDDNVEFDTDANIKRATARLLAIAPSTTKKDGKLVIAVGNRNTFTYQAAREVQKFDLSRETALELLATLFEWEGSFEENMSALDSAFAKRHEETGTLNPERVFGDKIAAIAEQQRQGEAPKIETEHHQTGDGATKATRDPWLKPYRYEDLERVRHDNPLPRYLVHRWVLGGFNNLLAGASKAFKSYFASTHLVTLGMGITLDGAECERMLALHLSYEDPIRPLMERIAAIVEYTKGTAKRDVLPGHEVIDFQPDKHRHRLMTVTGDGVVIEHDDWKRLCDRMAAAPGEKFVVLDSFYNAFDFQGASKVNESAVMDVLGRLDELCATTRTTIETVAHPSRAAQREGQHSMGFSNAMDAGPRHRVYASRVAGMPAVIMREVANQYGEDGFTETFYLERGVLRPKHPTGLIPLAVAIVQVALQGADSGQFIIRNRAKASQRQAVDLPGDWVIDEIERLSGQRPPRTMIRQMLDLEVDTGRWSYTVGRGHDIAGYRPVPEAQQPGYRHGEDEPKDHGAEVPDEVG